MLVNLMPPVEGIALREPDIIVASKAPTNGFLRVHPRYRAWLARCGLHTAEDVLNLSGEIVSGHANRHVQQVGIRSGSQIRNVYLKREHRVSWRVRMRNWLDGFGRVSRSEREAKVLERLESAGLPGPHWIAYGEDGAGRAFLLVDELTGYRELRELLAETKRSLTERAALAESLGKAIADLHNAGFPTPDLSAKHVFVRPGSNAFAILDWPSSKPGTEVDRRQRCDALAGLNASLVESLANRYDRYRMLRAYCRQSRLPASEFKQIARTIAERSRKWLRRSSIRMQRQSASLRHNHRLVWLAGESLCATPEVANSWPRPVNVAQFYAANPIQNRQRSAIELPGQRTATLVQFRTVDPLGRLIATARGTSWRSPAATAARMIFHLQNAGIETVPLMAFGQRITNAIGVDSFVVHGTPPETPTLSEWISQTMVRRDGWLDQLGGLLRSIHDAGCRMGAPDRMILVWRPSGRTTEPRFVVDPTQGMELLRNVGRRSRVQDLVRWIRCHPMLSTDEIRTLLLGYADRTIAERVRQQLAAS